MTDTSWSSWIHGVAARARALIQRETHRSSARLLSRSRCFLFFCEDIKVTLHSSNSNLRDFARLLSNHREINLQHLNLICTFFSYWNLLLHGCSISMPITRRTTSIGARAASDSSSSTSATTFPSPSSLAISRTYVTSHPISTSLAITLIAKLSNFSCHLDVYLVV